MRWVFNPHFTEETSEVLRGKVDDTRHPADQWHLTLSAVSLPQDHLMPYPLKFAAGEDAHECDAKQRGFLDNMAVPDPCLCPLQL